MDVTVAVGDAVVDRVADAVDDAVAVPVGDTVTVVVEVAATEGLAVVLGIIDGEGDVEAMFDCVCDGVPPSEGV